MPNHFYSFQSIWIIWIANKLIFFMVLKLISRNSDNIDDNLNKGDKL